MIEEYEEVDVYRRGPNGEEGGRPIRARIVTWRRKIDRSVGGWVGGPVPVCALPVSPTYPSRPCLCAGVAHAHVIVVRHEAY